MPYMRWGEICGRARTSRSAPLGLEMGIGGGRICDHPPPQLLDGQKSTHDRHAACACCTDPPLAMPRHLSMDTGEKVCCVTRPCGVCFRGNPGGGKLGIPFVFPCTLHVALHAHPNVTPVLGCPTFPECMCEGTHAHARNPTESRHARAQFPNEYFWGRGGRLGGSIFPFLSLPMIP